MLDLAKAFSDNFFKKRLTKDYVFHMQEYSMELVGAFGDMGPFWQIPGA